MVFLQCMYTCARVFVRACVQFSVCLFMYLICVCVRACMYVRVHAMSRHFLVLFFQILPLFMTAPMSMLVQWRMALFHACWFNDIFFLWYIYLERQGTICCIFDILTYSIFCSLIVYIYQSPACFYPFGLPWRMLINICWMLDETLTTMSILSGYLSNKL